MMKEYVPTALTASVVAVATNPDWHGLEYAVVSALLAMGLEWLRRWINSKPSREESKRLAELESRLAEIEKKDRPE